MSSEGALMYVALRRRWMSLLFYLVGLLILSRKQYVATDRVHPFSSFRRMINVSLISTESFTAGSGYFHLSLHFFSESTPCNTPLKPLLSNQGHLRYLQTLNMASGTALCMLNTFVLRL